MQGEDAGEGTTADDLQAVKSARVALVCTWYKSTPVGSNWFKLLLTFRRRRWHCSRLSAGPKYDPAAKNLGITMSSYDRGGNTLLTR